MKIIIGKNIISKIRWGRVITVILILSFVCLEIFFRITLPDTDVLKRIFRDSSNPKLIFELNPGAIGGYEGIKEKVPFSEIVISSQGFRDREFELHKDKGVVRVAFIGDSVAFGIGVDNQDSIPKRLEYFLNKKVKKTRFEVMNCAVPGYNFTQEVESARSKVLEFSPDVMVFFVIRNDLKKAKNILFSNFFLRHSFLLRFIALQYHFYEEGVEKNSEKLRDYNIKMMRRAIAQLGKIRHKDAKVVIVMKNVEIDDTFGKDFKTEFKYTYPLYKMKTIEQFSEQIFLSPQDHHYNKSGCNLVALYICKYLTESVFID